MLHENLDGVILILIKGSIFIKGPVSLLPSVCAPTKILFGAIYHMIYVAWTKLVIINDLVTHHSVRMFLGWLQIRTCICPLENSNRLIPN